MFQRIKLSATIVMFIVISSLLAVVFTTEYKPPAKLTQIEFVRHNSLHIIALGGRGSGVYVRGNKVMTAAHVCNGNDPKSLILVDYKNKRHLVDSYVVSQNSQIDLCLITLEQEELPLPGVQVGTDPKKFLNELVYIGGFAGGEFYSVRAAPVVEETFIGIMDSIFGPPKLYKVQIIQLQGIPGISGAGVLNERRELVGIANIAGPGVTGFVPLSDIIDFLKEIKQEELLK